LSFTSSKKKERMPRSKNKEKGGRKKKGKKVEGIVFFFFKKNSSSIFRHERKGGLIAQKGGKGGRRKEMVLRALSKKRRIRLNLYYGGSLSLVAIQQWARLCRERRGKRIGRELHKAVIKGPYQFFPKRKREVRHRQSAIGGGGGGFNSKVIKKKMKKEKANNKQKKGGRPMIRVFYDEGEGRCVLRFRREKRLNFTGDQPKSFAEREKNFIGSGEKERPSAGIGSKKSRSCKREKRDEGILLPFYGGKEVYPPSAGGEHTLYRGKEKEEKWEMGRKKPKRGPLFFSPKEKNVSSMVERRRGVQKGRRGGEWGRPHERILLIFIHLKNCLQKRGEALCKRRAGKRG